MNRNKNLTMFVVFLLSGLITIVDAAEFSADEYIQAAKEAIKSSDKEAATHGRFWLKMSAQRSWTDSTSRGRIIASFVRLDQTDSGGEAVLNTRSGLLPIPLNRFGRSDVLLIEKLEITRKALESLITAKQEEKPEDKPWPWPFRQNEKRPGVDYHERLVLIYGDTVLRWAALRPAPGGRGFFKEEVDAVVSGVTQEMVRLSVVGDSSPYWVAKTSLTGANREHVIKLELQRARELGEVIIDAGSGHNP